MMPIKRSPRRRHFTIIPNESLEDSALSFKARGLLAYMLSKSDDWTFYENELVKHTTEGRAAIRSALKELVACGYLIREQSRTARGGFANAEWTVFDAPKHPLVENRSTVETPQHRQTGENNPQQQRPLSDYPTTDNPTTGNPTTDNRTLPNTNLTKTNSTKDGLNQGGGGSLLYSIDTPPVPDNQGQSAATGDALKPVQEFWENNGFGSMTAFLWQSFEKWLTDFGQQGSSPADSVALILRGMQECVTSGKRNYKYLNGILNRYANSGFRSVADVDAHEAARKSEQDKRQQGAYHTFTGQPSKHDPYHDPGMDEAFQRAFDQAEENTRQALANTDPDTLPF